jgi:hypothetical protein
MSKNGRVVGYRGRGPPCFELTAPLAPPPLKSDSYLVPWFANSAVGKRPVHKRRIVHTGDVGILDALH